MTLPAGTRASPAVKKKIAELDQLEKRSQSLTAERRKVNSAAWKLQRQIVEMVRSGQ
jgi:hypothetical protein